MKPLYLDSAASTEVSKEVVKAVLPFFTTQYGNPSSPHLMGEQAQKAIQHARKQLASSIGAIPEELIFTSGATESNNLALQGLRKYVKRKIIVSAIEHASLMEPARFLERNGYRLSIIPVDRHGIIDYATLEREIDDQTLLVSVMHVNNVLGTIQDLKKIGALCRIKGVLFHTDASQSYGKLPINVQTMNIDLLSASAHKIGGPKGVGFLYVRSGVQLEPIILGGGQERGFRGGTENVPGIVGFARAFEIYKKVDQTKLEKLRNFMIQELKKLGGTINGSDGLATTVHVSFSGIEADTLVLFLSQKKIYVATGSACESKKEDQALRAIGLSRESVKGSVRITLNEKITKKDIQRTVKELQSYLDKVAY